MIITTILGSPRKRGNTAAVLTAFEEFISKHHEVNRLNIARKSINGCLGCEACQRVAEVPGCVQKDEINKMLETIFCSDMVVYACPVYVWDFTAQMKALIDRHFCFVKWKQVAKVRSLIHGKPTMLLATCGGSADENADLIQEIFKRQMAYLQCHIVGCYIVPNSTTPAELGQAASNTAQRMLADILEGYA